MPDAQIHPTGTVSTPADYVVPDSAELLLKGVYAQFDGSGAAGSYKPLVRIISDAGSTVIEAVSDTTIAAGASADASWFPHIGGGATSNANNAETAYVWGVNGAPVTVPSGGFGARVPWQHFQATNTSIFGTDTSAFASPPYHNAAGDKYLYFNKDGAYFCSGVVGLASGAYVQVSLLGNDGNQYVLDQIADQPRLGEGITTNVFTDPGGGTDVLTPFSTRMFYVDSQDFPGIVSLQVFQGSGANKALNFASLGLFYLGGSTADLAQVY